MQLVHSKVNLGLINGDGISPEVEAQLLRFIRLLNRLFPNIEISVEEFPYNNQYWQEHKVAFPADAPARLRQKDIVFQVAQGAACENGQAHIKPIVIDLFRNELNGEHAVRKTLSLDPSLLPLRYRPDYEIKVFGPLSDKSHRIKEHLIPGKGLQTLDTYSFEEAEKLFIQVREQAEEFLRNATSNAEIQGASKAILFLKENALKISHEPLVKLARQVFTDSPVQLDVQLMDSFLERLVRKPQFLPKVLFSPDRAFFRIVDEAVGIINTGTFGTIPGSFKNDTRRAGRFGKYIFRGRVFKNVKSCQNGFVPDDYLKKHIQECVKEAARKKIKVIYSLDQIEDYPLEAKQQFEILTEIASKSSIRAERISLVEYIKLALEKPEKLDRHIFVAGNLGGDFLGDLNAGLTQGIPSQGTYSYPF
ncbi:MAG: hypothetical protein KDD56_06670, partial [Bdellovibrionales bacterium]|nr:hypothetical protein [Bdellovibrionales bacterium]